MNTVIYILVGILAILLGQITFHLCRKMPPVVAEEITYKEFFNSLFQDFKLDIKYSFIYLILFVFLIYFNGNTVDTYIYVFMCLPLFLAFSIDFRYQLIPDETHIFLVVLGIIKLCFNLQLWWNYLLGAIIGGGIFWGLGLLALIIFKKEGMGFGDVKLMASLGFIFGIKYTLVITLVSFFLGAIIGGILLITKKSDVDSYIPFGPFIVVATILLMFVPADVIIDIYINFCSWLGMKMFDVIYFVMPK